MPELPDIAAYITALQERIAGQTLTGVAIAKPFVLRTIDPPISALVGRNVRELRRIGKRIAIGFDDDLWIVIHLMIAGRLQWRGLSANLAANRTTLASLTFGNGTLVLTEAGAKRRASMHVVRGEAALAAIDPGGIEPLDVDFTTFRTALSAENHTLKRTLTDPHIISGIGNAYSDEILHAAKLSPIAMTQKLDDEQWRRLYDATQATLHLWIDRFRAETKSGFPTGVTAFREGMAVHGRYREPCPICGEPVARIRYADNETNYCPQCQTGGKLLADRALSRLLKRG
ncbi:MAG TPA: DNA-formamidopyrimidine glycosylase family protein [Candidatus Baltobacteraceae bacterium]